MKFARYLEETQTPEWKKAYIDYRGLKKQISAIYAARQEHQHELIEERPRSRSATPPPTPQKLTFEEPPEIALRRVNRMSVKSDLLPPPSVGRGGMNRMSLRTILPNLMAPLGKSRPVSMVDSAVGRRAELLHSLPLHEILTLLSPQEVAFFTMLDKQLEKVESFYRAREEEMLARGRLLQTQLNELNEHRNRLLNTSAAFSFVGNFKSALRSCFTSDHKRISSTGTTCSIESPVSPSTVHSFSAFVGALHFPPQDPIPSVAHSPSPSIPGRRRESDEGKPRGRSADFLKRKQWTGSVTNTLDPDPESSYFSARRKLKKAVVELYRGLELLDNYRIMNSSGFRKIVKKFEKHTKIRVQNQYMSEKVERSAFASGAAIKDVMKQMEEMYAAAFEKDDKKKATARLRSTTAPQTHHISTFRTGLYLGLAVPVLIDGLRRVNQLATSPVIPWGVMLYLYGVLFLPMLFALLVGLNLAAWASARINYVFIFELDVLSRIDYRKYFEIPAFLLSTLICSFWLTFYQIGAPHAPFDGKWWPFIWFMFAIVVIANPLPIMHRSSRYWFIRNLGMQVLSGTRPVEFTDFWLGDQLCSMTFTLSHLATYVCAYVHQFQHDFPHDLNKTCGTTTNMWGVELTLLCLPQLIRFVQSVKRFADSRMIMHLVNAGKYASAIVYAGFYLSWRKNHTPALFVLWCFWGVLSSLYGCAWDLLMDWSLLSFRNKRQPLLRSELLYPDHVSIYYFAMVTNTLGRFSWVSYIPEKGPDMLARTFFVAFFELLRRFQWNFFRLENEHLGNVDQYRVTREVPLPYPLETMVRDDDDEMRLREKASGCKYSR